MSLQTFHTKFMILLCSCLCLKLHWIILWTSLAFVELSRILQNFQVNTKHRYQIFTFRISEYLGICTSYLEKMTFLNPVYKFMDTSIRPSLQIEKINAKNYETGLNTISDCTENFFKQTRFFLPQWAIACDLSLTAAFQFCFFSLRVFFIINVKNFPRTFTLLAQCRQAD